MQIIGFAVCLFLSSTLFFVSVDAAPKRMTPRSQLLVQDRNSITGFVFTESRTPIPDIFVELTNDLNVLISRTRTNGSGAYFFRGLSDGRYNVKIFNNGTGYIEQNRSVSLFGVSAIPGSGAIQEQADFYLKAEKNLISSPLAAPGVIYVQEVPDAARKLYESGIEELNNKREKEGFEKLKKSLEIFPTYFLALDRLGGEYVIRGYYAPAFVLLTKAVEINSRSFSSYFGLGLACYRLQQIDKSIEHFKRATEIYNKSSNAFLWFGIALHQNNNFRDSEIALRQADKLEKGSSAEVHWQLARLYKDQKRFQEAASELELYLKVNPKAENAAKVKEIIASLRQKSDGQ